MVVRGQPSEQGPQNLVVWCLAMRSTMSHAPQSLERAGLKVGADQA